MNTPSVIGPYIGDFERSLRQRGYQDRTVAHYVVKCRTFDSFLARQGTFLTSLRESCIQEFVAVQLPQRLHKDERSAFRSWVRPLQLLLEHLRRCSLIPPAPRSGSSAPPILVEYLSFLRDHRGICERSIEDQRRYLLQFLTHSCLDFDPSSIERVSVALVDAFLIERARHLSRQSINSLCSMLRGFLRFLHLRGLLEVNLASQVTRPRLYSLSSIPRAIPWGDVERTLALVDRSTLVGCRDYAILVLLAYCGLRASEVAGLCLSDLDWSDDTIRVRRCKTQMIEYLPLVPLVGEALIAYLRLRPASELRQVFLKVLAPVGPLNRPCISWLTTKYLRQAGVALPFLGAHALRHSYAVRLLRQGFSLKTIGDSLGHRHPQSTFIYAKAAVDDLREVSLSITEVLP